MSFDISKQIEVLMQEEKEITPEIVNKILNTIYDRVKDIPGYKDCSHRSCKGCILSKSPDERGGSKCVAYGNCMDVIRKERLKREMEDR